jgi:MFS family permease
MSEQTLWRHPDFLRLWFGQTVSNFGDKISLVALPSVAIIVLHGGALEVGVLGALRFVPFLVLGPFVGVLADRVSRRHTMVLADAGRLIALASVPIAAAFHQLTTAHLFVAAGVAGVLSVFFEVSYQSYLPTLVGRAGLMEANSKLQLSRSSSQVFGSALAGALIASIGAALTVLVDAVSFFVSAVSLVLMRHREEPKTAAVSAGSAGAQLKEGLGVLFGHRLLRPLMLSSTVGNIGTSMGAALFLVYAYDQADLTPGEVGVTFAIGGVGFVVGALAAKKLALRIGLGPALAACPLIAGIGYGIVPGFHGVAALIGLSVAQFLIGVAQSVYNIQVMSLVGGVTPMHLMGRVGGGAMALVWGAMSFGSMIGGLTGDAVGVSTSLVAAGVLVVVSAGFIAFSPIIRLHGQPTPDAEAVPETATTPPKTVPQQPTGSESEDRSRIDARTGAS